MALLEGVLVLVAQRHDRAHVHLVEGGQHGGGVLGLLQPARDGLAQAGHAHPLLALVQLARRSAGRRARGGVGGAGLQRGQGVALGDAAVLAGAGDGRRDRACSRSTMRCTEGASGSSARRAAAGAAARLGRGFGRRPGRARRLRRCGPALGARLRRPARRAPRLGQRPSRGPASTVAPSSAAISLSTPSAGAATSRLTLSVSSSTRISSLTASPAFLAQRPPSPR